ncbi:MAG: hypothetical protein FWD56_08280, partial [Bacteroidales bacterium]|nr:hypothetical protein [Bacteroidales bacterium]
MRWKGLKIVSAGLLMVAGICLATCDNVKDLDDNARISVVKIEVASPSAVLLGDPQIEKEEVVIPLIFGKYLFPIEIRVDIQTVQTIDKILGLSAGNGMVFESLEEINRIDLVALSGVVHSYIFKLNEVPSSEDANIEKFEITSWTPDSFLFIRAPHYDVINGVIEIIGVSNHFPFTITPRITISDGAKMETSVAVNSFTFTSYTTQFPIKVVAESGKERLWQIGVKQAQIIRPQEAPDVDSRARLSINTQAITATLSGGGASEIKSVDVDADNSTIRITIQTQHVDSQWEAQLSFQVPPYTEIVGYESGEAFTIDGMGLQKSFYLIDILEGCGVEWKIESVRWLSPAADIESFELISYESEYSLIELGAPVIYPYLATVEIPLEGGFGFPLIIDSFGLQISEDALLMDPLPEKLIFNDFDTKYTVRIEAQDKSVKNWTIALYDARSGNSEARVTGYAIKSYAGTSSTDNNLILNPQAAINADNKTITLHILDWAHKLPLKVEGRVDISTGARLFPFSFLADHSLIFDSLEDTFSFTIISENGETEQTWTILLQNDALPKSSAKEVIDFISGAPSIGFLFAEKYLEHEKRQITLIVSERPSGAPLILAPRIAVSPQARLLEIVSGAQLSLSFDQPKLFYVQAEDEGIDEWRIVLVYAPQIPNSGFESWGRANNSDMNLLPSNGTGWCTSNNSTMSNASRVAGFNSPYAVQMQTVLQTMNFVI